MLGVRISKEFSGFCVGEALTECPWPVWDTERAEESVGAGTRLVLAGGGSC